MCVGLVLLACLGLGAPPSPSGARRPIVPREAETGPTPETILPPGESAAPPVPRTMGEIGESCRAAIDCQPHFRCKALVCVAREEPKPDRPVAPARDAARSRLRVGLEIAPGLAFQRAEEANIVSDEGRTSETLQFVTDGLLFVELGLNNDRLLLALAGGIGWPAGTSDRDPSARVELRAALRLWKDTPSVGLYLEPRFETAMGGGIPADVAIGGSLATRLRVDWFGVGIRVGGMNAGEGRRRIDEVIVVREEVTAFSAALFLAVAPTVAAW